MSIHSELEPPPDFLDAIPVLTYDEASDLVNSRSTFLLDVRDKGELLTDGKLQNSINIPWKAVPGSFVLSDQTFLEKYCRPKPTLDETILIYCRTGPRSLNSAEALQRLGYTNVKIIGGGIKDWKLRGGKTEPCEPRNMHFTGL